MRSITLITEEGQQIPVKEPVANQIRTIQKFLEGTEDKTADVQVPLTDVDEPTLTKILKYIETLLDFDSKVPKPKDEIDAYKAQFVNELDDDDLKIMMSAANYLDASDLLDFLAVSAAKRIEGKSIDYIKEFLNIEPDMTPAEEAALFEEFRVAFPDDDRI